MLDMQRRPDPRCVEMEPGTQGKPAAGMAPPQETNPIPPQTARVANGMGREAGHCLAGPSRAFLGLLHQARLRAPRGPAPCASTGRPDHPQPQDEGAAHSQMRPSGRKPAEPPLPRPQPSPARGARLSPGAWDLHPAPCRPPQRPLQATPKVLRAPAAQDRVLARTPLPKFHPKRGPECRLRQFWEL